MARPKVGGPETVSLALAETPVPADTVRVVACADLPAGCGSLPIRDRKTGLMVEDPGRLRGGYFWGRRYTEHDLTLEQLAEVEADPVIQIREIGGTPVAPRPITGTVQVDGAKTPAQYDRLIADLQQRVLDAEHKAVQAVELARAEATRRVSDLHATYDRKVASLENELRAANASATRNPSAQAWFVHDEEAIHT